MALEIALALQSELRIVELVLASKPALLVEGSRELMFALPQEPERLMARLRSRRAPVPHQRSSESGLEPQPMPPEAMMVPLLPEPEPFDSALALQPRA
jgi:hypothetical protein